MKNFKKKILIGLLAIVPALVTANQSEDNARDLYFSPAKALFASNSSSTTIASNNRAGEDFTASDNGNLGGIGGYYEKLDNPGVTHKIELLRKGSNTPKIVTSNHVFKSGDRIRVHISSNADGYMHTLHKGSSGNSILIPTSTGGRVINGQSIAVPSNSGWLRFDDQKGVEVLDVVFASAPAASSLNLIPNQANSANLIANVQQASLKYSNSKSLVTFENNGEKDLVIENGVSALTPVVVNRTTKPATEVIQAVYSAPANYAVNTAGEPIAIKIRLRHQ